METFRTDPVVCPPLYGGIWTKALAQIAFKYYIYLRVLEDL
jgi:hypothetical protein